MNFIESIKTCFTKYVDFEGRASRSEYWWFILFCFATSAILKAISPVGFMLSGIFYLAVILPAIAVEIRRLHDTNRTGWLILLNLIPVLGWIILIVWKVQPGNEGTNQYGPPPARPAPPSLPS